MTIAPCLHVAQRVHQSELHRVTNSHIKHITTRSAGKGGKRKLPFLRGRGGFPWFETHPGIDSMERSNWQTRGSVRRPRKTRALPSIVWSTLSCSGVVSAICLWTSRNEASEALVPRVNGLGIRCPVGCPVARNPRSSKADTPDQRNRRETWEDSR